MGEIELRRIQAGDGPALGRVFADDEVVSWLAPAGESGRLEAEELDRIAGRKAAHWKAHDFGQWLVWSEGEPVARGGLQYTIVAGRAEVEIGWAVARARWGEGIGGLLADRGLALADRLGLASVVAFTRPENVRSLALIERCGMRFEREFEHSGHRHVLYRRLP
jgi:RimJ/RimL family protein N-acetyltransferase